jgi:hypothetical protein
MHRMNEWLVRQPHANAALASSVRIVAGIEVMHR